MDLILLDWTRMGKSYCLAGVVEEAGSYRVVRPLLARGRPAPVRNVGWSPYLLDGRTRWEIIELIGAVSCDPEPPHLEDYWVRAIRSRRRWATPDQRRAILHATMPRPGEPLFGAPQGTQHSLAYLPARTGSRSLVTCVAPATQIKFHSCRRSGLVDPDIRVCLPLPGLGERDLPVKDHHLLCRAEAAAPNLEQRLASLNQTIQSMGEQVAIRLGLSRPFLGEPGVPAVCWHMADGFFSLSDPQP